MDFTNFHGILTASESMKSFFAVLEKVAKTDSAVLIRGETGTGKELVAKAIHKLSLRGKKPFYAINCAMMTPELMASELFGHKRGAFTGANADHKGYFEAAHTGSLFLDEIAEMPLTLQPRLLRALQERTISPVGSTNAKKVDVRLISATHKALRKEVFEQRFREDLMYRVRVVPVFLPKLKDRDRDIELLTWKFIEEFNQIGHRKIESIEASAYDALMSYTWPGNIRELRNNIEYSFATGEGHILRLCELTPELRGLESSYSPVEVSFEKDRSAIESALKRTGGKKGEAAKMLGMSRATFWRKLQQLKQNETG